MTKMMIPSPLPVMSGVEPPPAILSRVAIGDFRTYAEPLPE